MIISLLVICLALCWLGYETDWLTVRLYDWQYDDLELDTIDDDELDAGTLDMIHDARIDEEAEREVAYWRWLRDLYTPKLRYGTPLQSHYADYPQYAWQAISEDLEIRRRGEAIYQRGKW